MNCMSCASRSQSPARSATQAAAPSASDRFLSTLARDWRAYFRAFADPFELDPLRRLAVFVAIEASSPSTGPLPRKREPTHGRQALSVSVFWVTVLLPAGSVTVTRTMTVSLCVRLYFFRAALVNFA